MAVHTVPQDVETDDKILGPFNLRQFLYLIAVVALCGIAYLLARLFIALIIIPIPFIIFFLILALPLKKDQPMETYLAAKISFLFKNNRKTLVAVLKMLMSLNSVAAQGIAIISIREKSSIGHNIKHTRNL